jgi:hypothetical protein
VESAQLSIARKDNLNPPDQDQAESGMTTRLPVLPDLINLDSQARLIELFPMAAYAVLGARARSSYRKAGRKPRYGFGSH